MAKLQPAKIPVPPVAADLAALPTPAAAAAPVVSTPSPKLDAAPLQQAEDGAVKEGIIGAGALPYSCIDNQTAMLGARGCMDVAFDAFDACMMRASDAIMPRLQISPEQEKTAHQ